MASPLASPRIAWTVAVFMSLACGYAFLSATMVQKVELSSSTHSQASLDSQNALQHRQQKQADQLSQQLKELSDVVAQLKDRSGDARVVVTKSDEPTAAPATPAPTQPPPPPPVHIVTVHDYPDGWDFPETHVPAKIVFAADVVGWHDEVNIFMGWCPDVKCYIVEQDSGSRDYENADAVVFHGPRMNDDKIRDYTKTYGRKEGSQYFALTGESAQNYPNQRTKLIDGLLNGGLTEEVPVLASHWIPKNFDWFYLNLNKRTDAHAVFFVSNCHTGNNRQEWFKGLMDMMPIHAAGPCMHNHDVEGGDPGRMSSGRLLVQGEYKFCLAFENTNDYDYVTEKPILALAAGCVPIYMGSELIDDYVPRHSVIKTADFKNVEELGKYMLHLVANPVEYNKYLAWKTDGHSLARVKRLQKLMEFTWGCRMCRQQSLRLHKHIRQRALNFMGIGECDIEYDKELPMNEGTLEVWVKTTRVKEQAVFATGGKSGDGYILTIDKDRLGFTAEHVSTFTDHGLAITDGRWHHIAVSFTKKGLRVFYYDGREIKRATDVGPIPLKARNTGITIGVPGFETYERYVGQYEGMMDEIRIWNVVRSTEQIEEWWAHRLVGTEDGLAVYYNPSYDAVNEDTFLWDYSGKYKGNRHDAICHNTQLEPDPAPLTRR